MQSVTLLLQWVKQLLEGLAYVKKSLSVACGRLLGLGLGERCNVSWKKWQQSAIECEEITVLASMYCVAKIYTENTMLTSKFQPILVQRSCASSGNTNTSPELQAPGPNC